MNISKIHSCYGCGVCSMACGKKIIDIRLNTNGFYEPYITNPTKCTDCGLCLEVCSYNHEQTVVEERPKISYGAWSNDENVRNRCASGGVGFEIGRLLIEKGYKVAAVRYNVEKQRAEHYIASTVENFVSSMGSKYIQSYTLNGFKEINRREKYLVTGTPCQIDSFRRYIKKFRCEDNFILMDFFCHGVPTALVWRKYLKEKESQLGKIETVAWRNKENGWHDSWAIFIGGMKSHLNSRWTKGDAFYNMFLGNNCLGKACYKHCKFKYNHSSADIRIGDMWGDTYKDNEKGVTACVAFTQQGADVLKQSNCTLVEYPFEQVAEGQIEHPIPYPGIGWNLIVTLSKLDGISMNTLVFASKVVGKLNRILRKYE